MKMGSHIKKNKKIGNGITEDIVFSHQCLSLFKIRLLQLVSPLFLYSTGAFVL